MRRREALAGIASLGVLAGGGAVAVYGMPSFDGDGEDAKAAEPRELAALDVPWHDGEPVSVPEPGHVTVCKLFATTCRSCAANLPDVTAAHEATDPAVRFRSVTAERVGPGGQVRTEDVESWWADHGGGEWPIAVDETAAIRIGYELPGTPSTIVFDADGVARFTHAGALSTEDLLAEVEAAGGD